MSESSQTPNAEGVEPQNGSIPNESGSKEIAPSKTEGHLRIAMRVIWPVAGFGALGGLVRALSDQRSHKLRLPFFNDVAIEMGFLGDGYVGAMASVAAFILVGALFGLLKAQVSSFAEWFRIISVSVIAGYIGSDLLDSLSNDLVTRIDSLQQDVQADFERMRGEIQAGAEVLEAITRLEDATEQRKAGKHTKAEKLYLQALVRVNRAIEFNAKDRKAFVEKAKILSGLARNSVNDEEERRRRFEEAIATLGQAIDIDRSFGRAYYNRACYACLLGQTDAALRDLKRAVDIDPIYRGYAPKDSDFDRIKGLPEFKDLTR